MSVRAEHLMGLLRRLDAMELVTRLFVLDEMVDLIGIHIGPDAAEEVQKLYVNWIAEEGDYNAFKKLFEDTITGAENLTETMKYRFRAYVDFLFPPPMPT